MGFLIKSIMTANPGDVEIQRKISHIQGKTLLK